MRQKRETGENHGEKLVNGIRLVLLKQFSLKEKVRIVVDGLRGEESCVGVRTLNKASIMAGQGKFLKAGKKCVVSHPAREATSSQVKDLRRQARDPKDVVAERACELQLPKKHDGGWGQCKMRQVLDAAYE